MDDSDADHDPELAQRERAQRSWQLVVTADAALLSAPQIDALRRILRIKRFEQADFLARLPGPLRSGARVDLEPLRQGLERADIPCRLERRGNDRPEAPGD